MKTNASGTLALKLYVRPGCHLCEDAEAELEACGSRYPHTLERIDIDGDAELTRRYWDQIPVLVVDEREYPAPLSHAVIEQALRAATSRADRVRPKPAPSPSHATEASSPPRAYPWSPWRGR